MRICWKHPWRSPCNRRTVADNLQQQQQQQQQQQLVRILPTEEEEEVVVEQEQVDHTRHRAVVDLIPRGDITLRLLGLGVVDHKVFIHISYPTPP